MNLENDYLVSVCVPVYKVEQYIERCARSLFEQTYENIEYVFVDDCSPDNSIAIVKRVAEQYPHRKPNVRLIRHKTNSGLGQARNTGVCEAKGDFILHVDSDDYIDANVVKWLVEKQKETKADIVRYPKKILYKTKTQIEQVREYNSPRDLLEDILACKTAGNVCGGLIRTSPYRDYNIKVEGHVNQSEDFQVMTRLLYYAKSIAVVNDVYYYYDRTGENSYSNNMTERSYQQIAISLELIDDFLMRNNEKDLCSLLWKGVMIGFCRSKMGFCRADNRQMYNHICDLIERYLPKLSVSLPFKYRLLISCKNYQMFKLLMQFK